MQLKLINKDDNVAYVAVRDKAGHIISEATDGWFRQEQALRDQMQGLDRLISLREQQTNEEINALDEALRGLGDLRTEAQSLRQAAAGYRDPS